MAETVDLAEALRLTLHLALGGFLGVVIREIYKRWGETPSNREEFGNLFPLFTLATIVAVYIARQSLALSLGLLGAVSIVRYRAAIKSPEELVYLLFCVSVGLAVGADQWPLALISVPIVGLFIAVRHLAFSDSGPTSLVPDAKETTPPVAGRSTPAVFTLVPSPPARTGVDLLRREVKFAMTNADSDKLRTVLNVNCRRISHGGPSTVVSTLYFDDPFLGSCREHLEGTPRRAKIRLRWYDDDVERLFFEIKRREYSVVHKERFALRPRLPLTEMTYPEMVTELTRALPSPAADKLRSRPHATLLTRYRREYFRARDSSTRLTLDEQIVSYSQFGLNRPSKRFGIKATELVILEAKMPDNAGDELRDVLYPLEPYLTKSSKYVRGCLELGLLAESRAY